MKERFSIRFIPSKWHHSRISENIDRTAEKVVDATEKHLIAGVIDDQSALRDSRINT